MCWREKTQEDVDQGSVPSAKLCGTRGRGVARQDRDGRTREELGLEGSTDLGLWQQVQSWLPPM